MKGMYFFNVLFFYFPPPLSAIPSGKGMYFYVFVCLCFCKALVPVDCSIASEKKHGLWNMLGKVSQSQFPQIKMVL